MKLIEFSREHSQPIELFESVSVSKGSDMGMTVIMVQVEEFEPLASELICKKR